MNAVRSQTKQTSVDDLRKEHQQKLARAYLTGQTPAAFKGDPTFQDAICSRRKLAEADRAA